MKILFISGEFPPQPGGVGDYTDRLAGALADRGEDVAVLTSAPTVGGGAINADAEWANREGASVARSVNRWNLRAWRLIAARIRAEQPDVVHLQYQAGMYAHGKAPGYAFLPFRLRKLFRRLHRGVQGAAVLYPWLLRSWNIRPLIVVTFHDLLPPHLFPLSGKLGLDQAAVRRLARSADACIATNSADAAALVRLNAPRVWEVPIGANIPVVEELLAGPPWRERLGVAADAPLIAYFGFLTPGKGVDDLLTAFAALLKEKPGARLLLIGGGAVESDPASVRYAAGLKRLANSLGIADRLVPSGFTDAAAVSAQLQTADVVALPYQDGASLRRGTLMAALSHGCAIVTTTPVQPAPALEQAVVCCAPNDPVALQQGILAALAERGRLRQAAREIAALFTWPEIAASHSALYRALCRLDT